MTTEVKPTSKMFGIAGVVFAFLALLTILVGPSIQNALYPPPSVEDRVADTAVKIRDRVAAHLKRLPTPQKHLASGINSTLLLYDTSLALAAVAILMGCVSYLRREDLRYAYVACGVGVLALAWYALILAIGALVLCIIIFSVLSSIDFT